MVFLNEEMDFPSQLFYYTYFSISLVSYDDSSLDGTRRFFDEKPKSNFFHDKLHDMALYRKCSFVIEINIDVL